jgi:tetraacyldisaccharide 4'-kinase
VNALVRAWWRRGESPKARALLAPLLAAEAGFRGAVAARGALYRAGILRPERVDAPVISVGNLAVGGAGKTPAVMAVAERLAAAGRTVAVLSRGYGARRRDARVVSDGRSLLLGAGEGGDEPVLLARRLPGARVLCGPRRAELARRAVAEGADALVLDDGFQHRALARDLDVVVLDASDPFGNGHCLPRGPNREPLAALRRAGLVWLSRVDQAGAAELEDLRRLARRITGRDPVESRHSPLAVLDGLLEPREAPRSLRRARVLLLSGLARPEAFRRTVESLGATVAAERIYPDHHTFSEAELDEALSALAPAGCDWLLTTEKDAVRVPPSRAGDPRLRVLRVEAEVVAGGEVLDALLAQALSRHPAAISKRNPASASTSTPAPTATPASTATPTLRPGRSLFRSLLLALGALAGWLGWALHVRRGVVLSNLRLAFPDLGEAQRRDIARRTFVTLGRNMGEFLALPRLSRDELEGLFVYDPGAWEGYLAARDRGKGVIACTAHFGNFEALASVHNLRGVPITTVSRPMRPEWFDRAWRRFRRSTGVEEVMVKPGETLKGALRALKSGRVLGYVFDQNVVRNGIFPTFFGVPAATAAAPYWLAVRTGAAVVFVLDVALPDGRHRIVIEGPLEPPRSGDAERDALAFMQDLNDRLERFVREYPHHWYWLHRRWKTRPAGEAAPPGGAP